MLPSGASSFESEQAAELVQTLPECVPLALSFLPRSVCLILHKLVALVASELELVAAEQESVQLTEQPLLLIQTELAEQLKEELY
jgi:hypothetical protein